MELNTQRRHPVKAFSVRCAVWLLLWAGGFAACQNGQVRLKGHFTNCSADYLLLNELSADGMLIVDTMALVGGRFMHSLRSQGVKIYLIPISDTLLLPFIAQPGDRLQLTADAADFDRTYRVDGNEESRLLLQLRQALTRLDDSIRPLSRLFSLYRTSDSFSYVSDSLQTVYETHVGRHRAYLRDFIEKHPDKLAALTAFYQTLGRRAFFDPAADVQLMERLAQHLSIAYPGSEYVEELKLRIEHARQKRTLQTGH